MNATLCLLTASLLMGADETAPLGEERLPIVEASPTVQPIPSVMPTPMVLPTTGCASCGNACAGLFAAGTLHGADTHA